MKVRKPIVGVLAVGLVVGGMLAPAQAKKKKPKPPPAPAAVQADQKYFLANTNESGCAAEGMLLVLTALDTGSSCGATTGGAGNTALITAGDAPCTPDTPVQSPVCGVITHTAAEGLPLVLDATKKITGTIFVSSYRGAAQNPGGLSAGQTTFNMNVVGTVNGEDEKLIGTFTSTYTVTPDKQIYEVPFEIVLDPTLDKAQVTALRLDLMNTGATALHGFYNVNTSNIVLPTWATS